MEGCSRLRATAETAAAMREYIARIEAKVPPPSGNDAPASRGFSPLKGQSARAERPGRPVRPRKDIDG